MYPVYVKDGQEQIAPTPRDEVRLRFTGWQLKDEPANPADAVDAGDGSPPADNPAPGEQTTRRGKRGSNTD